MRSFFQLPSYTQPLGKDSLPSPHFLPLTYAPEFDLNYTFIDALQHLILPLFITLARLTSNFILHSASHQLRIRTSLICNIGRLVNMLS